MISQTNNSVVHVAYPSKANESKGNVGLTKVEDTNKLKQLKESINSGEYKVNIEALSQEIAKTLL